MLSTTHTNTMTATNMNNKRTAEQTEECKRRKWSESLLKSDDSTADDHSTPVYRSVPCVVFNLEPTVSLIPNRLEYTEEEAEDIWYSGIEKQAMIQGALKSASDMHPSDALARGLESLTYAGSMARRAHRFRPVSAVLREQERQKQRHGDTIPPNSDELLCQSVAHLSARCQESANQRAYQDELAAFPEKGADLKLMHSNTKGDTVLSQTLRAFTFGWLTNMAEPQ